MSQNPPNAGSRARDHLANERTYLAWVRTSLGGLALGVAVERFGHDGESGSMIVLAVALIVMSLGALAVATRRYYHVASELEQGRFGVDRVGPAIVSTAIAVLAVIALLIAL